MHVHMKLQLTLPLQDTTQESLVTGEWVEKKPDFSADR